MTNEKNHAVFGFPDFGQRVFGAHQKAFDQAILVSNLANEMFVQTDKMPLKRERFVIYLLVRMAVTGWTELLILVGNGAGLGAMKISRGMFEAAVMAEYLRRTPEEIDDYLDFFHVLSWKRLQIYPDSFKPRQKKKIQTEYDRVKARFENRKGRVRDQWNKHSIRQMASVLGRKDQYDLPYSIAASMHHSNFEAMVSHVGRKNKRLYVDQPPSMNWVPQAFISGHVYLLQALETLNDCFHLGFDSRLKAENDAFLEAWGKKTNQSQRTTYLLSLARISCSPALYYPSPPTSISPVPPQVWHSPLPPHIEQAESSPKAARISSPAGFPLPWQAAQ